MNPWESYLSSSRENLNKEIVSKRESSFKSAIQAKCFDCTAGYADGGKDCEVTYCPLYQWMPYRKQDPNFTWARINVRKKSRNLSEEQREKLAERLKLGRQKKYDKK